MRDPGSSSNRGLGVSHPRHRSGRMLDDGVSDVSPVRHAMNSRLLTSSAWPRLADYAFHRAAPMLKPSIQGEVILLESVRPLRARLLRLVCFLCAQHPPFRGCVFSSLASIRRWSSLASIRLVLASASLLPFVPASAFMLASSLTWHPFPVHHFRRALQPSASVFVL